MAEYRATRAALGQIEEAGEVALDFIREFELLGERKFTTSSGIKVEITVVEDFLCVHLASECPPGTVCARRNCLKLKNGS
jgi:hypothetical protein